MARRKTIFAMLMLLAYLPAVLLSSLHSHETVSQEPVQCHDCVNHNHHSGHIGAAFAHHNCLLCQFLQQTYIGNDCKEPEAVLAPSDFFFDNKTVEIQSYVRLNRSPRAPPALL